MLKLNCEHCGKEFYTMPSYIENGRKYCSRKCAGIHRRGKKNWKWKEKIMRICKQCEKEFHIFPCRTKEKGREFCSRKCYYKWQSKNNIGKKANSWKGGKVHRKCQLCGKDFSQYSCIIKRGGGKFCSRSCKGIWIYKHSNKKNTSIEIAIENELIKRGIEYQKQYSIPEARAVVDFMLNDKVIIQADGDFWHRLQKNINRDISQDFYLNFLGYKVYRFWEHDINKNVAKCIDNLINEKSV